MAIAHFGNKIKSFSKTDLLLIAKHLIVAQLKVSTESISTIIIIIVRNLSCFFFVGGGGGKEVFKSVT